jgi:guanylate kinase
VRAVLERRERGTLFVVSAPSGTGKSTLARRLLDGVPRLEFSVSYTTRRKRPGETDGREYHFVDDDTFDRMAAAGEFLEWAEVFGCRYGTGRAATERVLATGLDLLLDIDVQGAGHVRESDVEAVSIFVLPPDFATLESRLRLRGSEREAEVQRRLGQARREANEFSHYDYVVVNDDIERATKELRAIVRAERARTERRKAFVEKILETFPEKRRDRRHLRATGE